MTNGKQLTQTEIDALYQENVIQFGMMYNAAGNMVKSLLYELQRKGRNTYIRLSNAEKDGHKVNYEMVQGDPQLVIMAAKALRGFKTVTESELEVNS